MYLPAGSWQHYWSGTTHESTGMNVTAEVGGDDRTRVLLLMSNHPNTPPKAPIGQPPVYLRAGSAVAGELAAARAAIDKWTCVL